METNKEGKMVPIKDLVALKQKVTKLEGELSTKSKDLESTKSRLQAVLADVDEGELKEVKEYFLNKDKEATERENKITEDGADLTEREKSARASELVATLKGSGIEVEIEKLKESEDMEAFAKDLTVEHLAEENKKLKEGASPTPESIFDTGSGDGVTVSVNDKSVAEFDAGWEKMKQEALSK